MRPGTRAWPCRTPKPSDARAAYREAVDAGYLHALIDLAMVLRNVLNDEDAAVAVYRQAIGSGDPDLAAEAMSAAPRASGSRSSMPRTRSAVRVTAGKWMAGP